jgi:hypothetical protein
MDDTTIAETLHITEGYVVWVVGRSVEETALLDPLPEGAEVVEHRDEEDPDAVDAAIVFVDDREALDDVLDDVLPQLGSIPLVWVLHPVSAHAGVDGTVIGDLTADYGWEAVEPVTLGETWAAVRLRPA